MLLIIKYCYYLFLIINSFACSKQSRPIINDRQVQILKLYQKINQLTNSRYGKLIIKYDLLEINAKTNKDTCLSSKLNYLINDPNLSNEQFMATIKLANSKINKLKTSQNLLDKLNKQANVKLISMNNRLKSSDIGLPKIDTNSLNNLSNLNNFDQKIAYLPILKPLKSYKITSNFGIRTDPFNKKKMIHYGIDLQGPTGAVVYATASGKVEFAGTRGRYGNLVIINHHNNYYTYYAHLNKMLVKKDQLINSAQKIGIQGNTGRSTNEHLHYEIKQNKIAKNAKPYLKFVDEC